jgi:hypothetical protein
MSAQSFPASVFTQTFMVAEGVLGCRLSKALTLPQGATSTLFTVVGGAVLVTDLIGVVTTSLGSGAGNMSLGTAPTIGTAETAGIGGPTAVASLAAGSCISAPATIGVAGMSLASPAVALTGVPVTNSYHGTAQVVVTGGTLTGILVNGVTVGTTAGTYQVPAHGTISWTGSVAPTWAWTSSGALSTGWSGSVGIGKEFVVSAGTITWTMSGSAAGAVTWYINYIPLDNDPGNPIGTGIETMY